MEKCILPMGIMLLIYPNPATDILTVETEAIEAVSDGEMNVSTETLSLVDSDLRIKPYIIQLWHERQGLVRTVKSTKRITQISLLGLPKGMYFVHVQNEGEAVQKQMLWVR